MIITKDLIRDCLHCIASTAQTRYEDNDPIREQLMENQKGLVTVL